MVDVYEITKYIEDGLNALTDAVEFHLTAVIGNYMPTPDARKEQAHTPPKPVINGSVVQMPSAIVPVKNLDNLYVNLALEIIVKPDRAQQVNEILETYIEQNVGSAVRFGEYAALVGFDTLNVGAADFRPSIGESVPFMTMVYFQLIKDGVLSNECTVTLNGSPLVMLDYHISRSRTPDTQNVQGNPEMTSAIGQQGLAFDMTIPYKTSGITKELMTDIMAGALGKTYTLTYADPVVGEKSWKVVLQSGVPNYQAGKVPTISLTFLIAAEEIYE